MGQFYVRAANEKDLAALKPRVQACFEAGATGSGCTVEVNWAGVDYLDLNCGLWPIARHHAEQLGRSFVEHEQALVAQQYRYVIQLSPPSIHPMLQWRRPML